MSIRRRPGHTGTRRKEILIKIEVRIELSNTKVNGSRPSSGIYVLMRFKLCKEQQHIHKPELYMVMV
jgi:hypothetical protein